MAPDDSKSRRRKIYGLKSEERPQLIHMTKSFYTFVMDNKEIGKTQNALANCTKNIKNDVHVFIKHWKPYHYLWKNDRTPRELMEYKLSDFEQALRYLAQLDKSLSMEFDVDYLGQSVAVLTERLKYGLAIEIKGELLKLVHKLN